MGDAVVLGLGSMIGAGVFAAISPAASTAGSGLLVGLAIAALVAYANATSSAQLAAVYPETGGTYGTDGSASAHSGGFWPGRNKPRLTHVPSVPSPTVGSSRGRSGLGWYVCQ